MRSDDSQSPTSFNKIADVGYSMFNEKKDKERSFSSLSSTATSSATASTSLGSKLIVPSYQSDSDEHEDQAANKCVAAASTFNENDLVDFDKLTCLLCKRAFPSTDVLNKHTKLSNLHKENLQKYKLQNGILDIGNNSSVGQR